MKSDNKEYYDRFYRHNKEIEPKFKNLNNYFCIISINKDKCSLVYKKTGRLFKNNVSIVELVKAVMNNSACVSNPSLLQNWNFCYYFSKTNKFESSNIIVSEKERILLLTKDKNGNSLNAKILDLIITNRVANSDYISLNIILEDSGSALKIFREIIKYYALKENINIKASFIKASGIGKMPSVLRKCVSDGLNNFIILYDKEIESKEILNLEEEIEYKRNFGLSIIEIAPYCIEELCITFKSLMLDIKNLSDDNKFLLSRFNMRLSDSISDYIRYDYESGTLKFGGKFLNIHYKSEYIKRYENICTVEQYIVDRLADITYNNPYHFVKSASKCWIKDCSDNTKCKFCPMCNKTNINKIKIEEIVNNSLFGLFYDAIYYYQYGKLGNKVLDSLHKKYIVYK